MFLRLGITLLTVLTLGCSTVHPPKPIVYVPGAVDRVAVCTGLDAVDPKGYDGWDGDCPGATVDAKGMFNLCTNKGLTATLLLDSQATWANVRMEILRAVAPLKRNDLVFLFFSGHGGQLPDDNGDEKTDGRDETLCMWDGQTRDDEVLKMLKLFPAGLRVVIFNDQCHAEGNFRSKPVKRSRALIRKTTTDWDGQLIQFAGCREARYSYGSDDGGSWTGSALSVFRDGNISWAMWFADARKLMDLKEQPPVWVEFGDVTDAFRNGKALE